MRNQFAQNDFAFERLKMFGPCHLDTILVTALDAMHRSIDRNNWCSILLNVTSNNTLFMLEMLQFGSGVCNSLRCVYIQP